MPTKRLLMDVCTWILCFEVVNIDEHENLVKNKHLIQNIHLKFDPYKHMGGLITKKQ